jgi:predicted nuclease of predicted toxin-antitoxin system
VTSFLLDANLSPETSSFLHEVFRFDVSDLVSRGLGEIGDPAVVALAQAEDRVIITFDLDLGEMFHRGGYGRFGVILLRLDDQTIESVNLHLDRFFRTEAAAIPLGSSLVVLSEERTRITTRI